MSLNLEPHAPCVGPLSGGTTIQRTVLFLDYSKWHIMPSWVLPCGISARVGQSIQCTPRGNLCSPATTFLVLFWGLKPLVGLCLAPKSIWGSQMRSPLMVSPCSSSVVSLKRALQVLVGFVLHMVDATHFQHTIPVIPKFPNCGAPRYLGEHTFLSWMTSGPGFLLASYLAE